MKLYPLHDFDENDPHLTQKKLARLIEGYRLFVGPKAAADIEGLSLPVEFSSKDEEWRHMSAEHAVPYEQLLAELDEAWLTAGRDYTDSLDKDFENKVLRVVALALLVALLLAL